MEEYKVEKHSRFTKWLNKLRDEKLRFMVHARLVQVEKGNFGDHKFIADDVWELRIHYGQGYRLYYTRRVASVVILLCAGDKSSQKRDKKRALKLAKGV